ncbi:MAG TPA: class I SAM-dependent methyltransferase [Pyrinomonadaceae bacterium]|nr:class I SAM-dependent methyltransferase [Pyrinomonadaceae bacterium]
MTKLLFPLCFLLFSATSFSLKSTPAILAGPWIERQAIQAAQTVQNPVGQAPKRTKSNKRKPALRKPDVIYYPTPGDTVNAMLTLADIKKGDVLYDLGSGDGRIPIMAAQQHGIRAVGIEIDPKLVAVAEERARQENVQSLVSFRNADMFRANISEASIVTLYLSNKINLLLRPKLLRELRPGTRILSHDFHMGDWVPEQKISVPWQKNLFRTIYLWRVPVRGFNVKTKPRTTPRT